MCRSWPLASSQGAKALRRIWPSCWSYYSEKEGTADISLSSKKLDFVIAITESLRRSVKGPVWLGGQIIGDVMLRYIAFLALGSAFVSGMVTTVHTHRLFTGPTKINHRVLRPITWTNIGRRVFQSR
jgi:hypothetical protein